jgi:DNA-binding transcriptional ArsR family regulator
MGQYSELNTLLHSQLRLAVMSILISAESAEFTYIQEQTGATAGNLSVQLSKLKEAGYIKVEKRFRKNYPQTLCRITDLGREQFSLYVQTISKYLHPE